MKTRKELEREIRITSGKLTTAIKLNHTNTENQLYEKYETLQNEHKRRFGKTYKNKKG